jgi:hypothetical protein
VPFDVQGREGGVTTGTKKMARCILCMTVELIAKVTEARGIIPSDSPVAFLEEIGSRRRP